LLLLLARRLGNVSLLLFGLLALGSLLLQFALHGVLGADAPAGLRFNHTSLAIYLWIFLLGVLAQQYFTRIAPWFSGKLHWWLVVYLAVVLLAHALGLGVGGNEINPLNMLALAGLVLSAALSLPGLSERLLRRNDLTYGLYLLHPVVWMVMGTYGFGQGVANATMALLLSFVFAAASWFLVERPFLRRKLQTVYAHTPGSGVRG
jgi:peptidoglycan/LPS O-acetylase OafA/YrhL